MFQQNFVLKEDYIQFLWQFLIFDTQSLKSTKGDTIKIHHQGYKNLNQGPDFSNARIKIGRHTFYGNIELHIDNQDWYRHIHHEDENYDNVILHVVYHNTIEGSVLNSKQSAIPILCLEDSVSKSILYKIVKLMMSSTDIPCCQSNQIPGKINIQDFKNRVFSDRIIRRSTWIHDILTVNRYDYELSFFQVLLSGFGIRVNSDIFLDLAQSIPHKVILKHISSKMQLEAILFGQSKSISTLDDYGMLLNDEYKYLKKLYRLQPIRRKPLRSKMMPSSFPSIRLAQFAAFIYNKQGLYSKLSSFTDIQEFYNYFNIDVSDHWKEHYDFGKPYKKPRSVKLTRVFIEKVIINVILPFRFLVESSNDESPEQIIHLYSQLKAESNNKTKRMEEVFGIENDHAFDSQALIEWYSNYCQKKKCLECPIGLKTLRN